MNKRGRKPGFHVKNVDQAAIINDINKYLIEGWGVQMAIKKAGFTDCQIDHRITGMNEKVLKQMTAHYYVWRKKTPHGEVLPDFFGGKEYRGLTL